MVRSAELPNPTSPGIEELIPLTDRQRPLTVLFEPAAAKLDAEFLVPPAVQPFFAELLDWFGRDVETIAWSLHLGSEQFFSEMLLRSQLTVRPAELQQKLLAKVESLPQAMLEAVQKMHPRERGKRRVIGRFPAMTKAFALASVAETGPRHVRLATTLPERAAPNLALGSLLTWDESTRTDFSKPAAPTPGSEPKLPDSLAERLNAPIDVDFRRTPLEEAFAYIFEETKVPHEIDGDALKLAGYTKNMPQTFPPKRQPATEALSAILQQYDKMCIVLDEQKKRALVTTLPAAQQQGLRPFLPK
jgi:hypothetical protein